MSLNLELHLRTRRCMAAPLPGLAARREPDGRWKAATVLLAALGMACLALDAGAQAPQAAPAPAHDERPGPVQAPHYGDTLWRFYQGKTFSAITSLMTSQHAGRIAPHDDEAEVLRGGMLLSYGLHREAGDLFARLVERKAPPSVQDRAWFYLAKIRYQRGMPAEAEDALGRIGQRLPATLEEERLLLAAQLRMARQDFAGAAELLREVGDAAGQAAEPARGWFARPDPRARVAVSPWLRFNLGVALLRQGDSERGVPLLLAVGTSPVKPDEAPDLRSLRDQANLALGYWALQAGNGSEAREHLARVRLHALHANRALLGFGWAASAQQQNDQALVAWTELAGRDPSDAAVLEARIAVPYAYAELGALGQAQTHYTAALDAYSAERQSLDRSIAAVRRGDWLARLLEANPGEEMGWFWQIGELPVAGAATPALPDAATPDLPHPGHLAPLLAEHGFQESLKNLRDLDFLKRNLAGWLDQIGAMNDILQHRGAVFAERLPRVQGEAGNALSARLAGLQRQRDALAAELQAAEAAGDGVAFADALQARLLKLIGSLQQRLHTGGTVAPSPQESATTATATTATAATTGSEPLPPDAADKLRLAAGALAWDLAHQLPGRQRAAQKALLATDDALARAVQGAASLARAQQEEPARLAAFGQRLAQLDARIRQAQPVVAALGDEQRAELNQLAIAALERQQQRLDEYTLQARFALAQLQDRAVVSSAVLPAVSSVVTSTGAADAPAR